MGAPMPTLPPPPSPLRVLARHTCDLGVRFLSCENPTRRRVPDRPRGPFRNSDKNLTLPWGISPQRRYLVTPGVTPGVTPTVWILP